MKNKKASIHYLIVSLLLFSFNNQIIAQEIYYNSENSEKYDNEVEKYKALGGNIFVGYGLSTGNISEYFTNPFLVGINVDILRQRMVFQIDGYLGFGKTKKTMEFPDNLEWSKNKMALHSMIGGNFGYTLVNTEALKFVPLAGIGFSGITSSFLTVSDNSKNEPLFPYYKVGFYIDIKSLRFFRGDYRFNYDGGYTCVRLNFGIKSQIGKRKYESFYQGNMIYFTIGFGGLADGGLAR